MLDVTRAYGLNFIFPAKDLTVGRCLRESGEFAPIEVDFILHHLADGAGTFLDVGGNVGSVALPVAARAPGVRVVSIEAQRALAGILAANALSNGLLNVEVIHAVAGAARGVARFPQAPLSQPLNFGGVGQADRLPEEDVLIRTLDDFVDSEVRAVKIDVQGAEAQVLAGAGRLIAQQRAVWIVEADTRAFPEVVRETMKIFVDAGYGLHWLFSPFVTPNRPKRTVEANFFMGDTSFVAIPPHIEPGWPLTAIAGLDDPKPKNVRAFPYLKRYGY